MIDIISEGEPYDEYLIKWKRYRSYELKNLDFLHLVDLIIEKECKTLKGISDKYSHVNKKWVELKSMKMEDLINIFLDYELLNLTPYYIKEYVLSYEKSYEEKTNKSKIKIVEYTFVGDELKFWDKNNIDNSFEIDLNDFIDWNEVNKNAMDKMKEDFNHDTLFVDVNEE